MIGRFVGAVMLFSLAGCAAMQAAQIVSEAKAKLQTISQACMQRMQTDRDLDPIRAKIELSRGGMSGAPPPTMLADQSRPTSEEKAAIAKWNSMRAACVQEQIQYGSSLSLPPNLEPLRDKLMLTGHQADERTGLLVAALYDGRLTYGEFAAERMKTTDQMVTSLTGEASPAPISQTLAAQPPTPLPSEDEIPLQRRGGAYFLSVAVNGFPPMPFLLDTGSTVVSLPAEVVYTLLRTGTLRSSDFIGNRVFVLADGRQLPSPTFRIRELRVGQHVIRDVVGSLSPALAEPLLGGSFLSRFASWRIDNQRNALILSP